MLQLCHRISFYFDLTVLHVLRDQLKAQYQICDQLILSLCTLEDDSVPPVRVHDFLICNLPEKIKSRIHLETLELAPQEYLTAALRKRAADAVYTVKLKSPGDEPGYLVVHIEHQVKPQRKMALRMLEFMLTTMRQISENLPKNDDTPLPVVIPITR